MKSQLQADAAQSSKWATLRYLSHELRSPLNIAANGIKFAMEDLAEEEGESLNNLKDVYHACTSAIHLLDDLLNAEKLEAGLLHIVKDFVSASELLEEIVNPLKVYAKQKGIDFKTVSLLESDNNPTERIGARMDRFKIEQVLRNLCVNAVKFTPSGGTVTVTIRTETVTTPLSDISPTVSPPNHRRSVHSECSPLGNIAGSTEYFLVEVTDTGVGIPESQRDKVFKQFFQLDPNKLQGGGGSGLGLWISKEIVTKHEGTLTFATGPGNVGTTFTIRLPATRQPADFPPSDVEVGAIGEGNRSGHEHGHGHGHSAETGNGEQCTMTITPRSIFVRTVGEGDAASFIFTFDYALVRKSGHGICQVKDQVMDDIDGMK
eukprot:gene225-230_t